ncbi:MAG: serine/threonine-protein kinase [Gemmataceae bacterium]
MVHAPPPSVASAPASTNIGSPSIDSTLVNLAEESGFGRRRKMPPSTPEAALPAVAGYETLAELGRGGQSVVYEARQLNLNRLVALKMISGGAAAEREHRARFHQEAEAVAQLQHPNIVRIHDVGEHDGQPYLALELVEGKSLTRWLAGRPQAPRLSAQVVATLALATHHAHQHGIVHRDLKPANVLMQLPPSDSAGQDESAPALECAVPRITDFGLAKRLSEKAALTRTGHILGTPSYMAPEQAAGNNSAVGPGADVYGLGAILYEMLSGRPPFKAETAVETLRQVLDEEPAAPSQFRPEIPRALEAICLKCLEKTPERRYPTAAALAEDLERFLAGRKVATRAPSIGRRLGRWIGRRSKRTRAAALALVLCLAVAALWLVRSPAAVDEGLIIRDDFDNAGPAAVALFDDRVMTFSRQDGAGALIGRHPGVLPVVYGERAMKDCVIDVTIRWPEGPRPAGAGVLFRATRTLEGLDGYYFLVFFPEQGKADLGYFRKDTMRFIKSVPWKAPASGQCDLRVEVAGPMLRARADGAPLFEVSDDVLPGPGFFCLTVINPPEVTTTRFEKLRVRRTSE